MYLTAIIIEGTWVHPIQVTSSSVRHILHHALGEAVVRVLNTWGRLSGVLGLLNYFEGAPHLPLGWDENGIGLTSSSHLKTWPKLIFLVEVYLKPLRIILSIALVHSSYIIK